MRNKTIRSENPPGPFGKETENGRGHMFLRISGLLMLCAGH